MKIDEDDYDEKEFEVGVICRCNRHNEEKFKAIKLMKYGRCNKNAYRMRGLMFAPCGAYDSHWMFLSDN